MSLRAEGVAIWYTASIRSAGMYPPYLGLVAQPGARSTGHHPDLRYTRGGEVSDEEMREALNPSADIVEDTSDAIEDTITEDRMRRRQRRNR